jgi:hypothetical protein
MERFGEIGQALATVDTVTTNLKSGTFTVSKDNVLAAAKIIQTQADALADKLQGARADLVVVPPGDDDVSTRIAPAWNDILVYNDDSYASRIRQYIDGLHNLARQCAESARAYGYTEEAVTAAFGGQGE